MNIQKASLLIILSFVSLISASAQDNDRTIRGKVVPSRLLEDCEKRPIAWDKIQVKVMHDGHPAPHTPVRSTGDQWMHKMPVGAKIEVGFIYACYRPNGLAAFTVSDDEPQEKGVVTLKPSYGCQPPCQRRPKRSATTTIVGAANARVQIDEREYGQKNTSVGEQTTVATSARTQISTDAIEKPSPEELLKDLQEDAEIAKRFNSIDVFLYNFEAMSLTFKGDKALSDALNSFKSQNVILFEPEGNRRPELFRNIIEKQNNGEAPLDRTQINDLIRDPSIDPSIKGSAVVALLGTELSEKDKEEQREIFREYAKDPSSDIYLTSVIALARIGNTEDRKRIEADIKDPDKGRASLIAIRVAQNTEGQDVFSSSVDALAETATSNSDPETRLAAIQALRTFALRRRYPSAIKALSQGLIKDSNEDVRIEAATALGLGTLERRGDIRAALRQAALRDSSPEVREAATFALSGRN